MTATCDTATATAALLDRIDGLWRAAVADYRDRLLEVGRLLRLWLVARLREIDGASLKDRLRLGVTREACVQEAADRLDVRRDRVNLLMQVAATVDLLAESVGDLPYSSLGWFRRFTRRRAGKPRQTRRETKVLEWADRETWELKPEWAASARALFRRAVAESWGRERVRREVLALWEKGGGSAIRGGPGRSEPEAESADLAAAVRSGSPQDVAALLAGLIAENQDARLVLALLGGEVERALRSRPKHGGARCRVASGC